METGAIACPAAGSCKARLVVIRVPACAKIWRSKCIAKRRIRYAWGSVVNRNLHKACHEFVSLTESRTRRRGKGGALKELEGKNFVSEKGESDLTLQTWRGSGLRQPWEQAHTLGCEKVPSWTSIAQDDL